MANLEVKQAETIVHNSTKSMPNSRSLNNQQKLFRVNNLAEQEYKVEGDLLAMSKDLLKAARTLEPIPKAPKAPKLPKTKSNKRGATVIK